MWTLRSLVLAHAIVTALSVPSEASPRARHVAEPVHKDAADNGTDASLELDTPEVAPSRPHAIAGAVDRDTGWHAGIAVGTDIPVDALSVGLVIQAPSGVRLSSSVGLWTDAVLGLIDSPEGGDATAVLLHAVMHDTIVWRTHLGMKPWKTHGFYASAGYSMCSFGGAITTGDAMSALFDRMLPVSLGSSPLVHLSSTLHALDVEAGWEWSLGHHFKFRTALGASTIIASSTSVQIDQGSLSVLPIGDLIAPLERAGEAKVAAMYKDVGPIVMLTVQLQLDLL